MKNTVFHFKSFLLIVAITLFDSIPNAEGKRRGGSYGSSSHGGGGSFYSGGRSSYGVGGFGNNRGGNSYSGGGSSISGDGSSYLRCLEVISLRSLISTIFFNSANDFASEDAGNFVNTFWDLLN